MLVVLAQMPALEGLAAGKCALGLLRGLEAQGVETTVVSSPPFRGETLEPPSDIEVEIVARESQSVWQDRWQRVRNPRGHLATGAFARRVSELAEGVDLLHLDEVDVAAVRHHANVPSVVHVHYLIERDRGMGAPWSSAARAWIEHRAAERRAVRNPWLVANSPEMASALRTLAPRSRVVVVPLTLDPAGYAEQAPLEEPVVGLIGTGHWPSTAEALRRMVSRVWPLVRAAVPEARLRLAGRGLPTVDIADGVPGVEWVGAVDSARDFVRGLGVLLFPVSRGSGTKVKVLEAMALGVPVVTTAAGAEGLVSRAGVAVHEDDESLAQATVHLLRDREARLEAGNAARAAFSAHHSPVAATRPLVDLYAEILG